MSWESVGISPAVAAILGMAAVTYATRLAGPMLLARVTIGPRGEAFLKALPGAILVSLIAPSVLGGGPAEWLGGAAALAGARLGGMPLALVAGVGVVWLARSSLG